MKTSFSVLALAALLTSGCGSKMDVKECDKLRGEAFDLINKGQRCNGDADCRQSEWPGCAKPVSQETFDKISPMAQSFKKGQCEEPKLECRESPEAYCKQGLCVHRETSSPGPAGSAAPKP